MSRKSPTASSARKGSRKRRSRPKPKWLDQSEVDDMAKRRCLMVLEVLSGRTPVTTAIEQAKISRGTYYQLETRALQAMLEALTPSSNGSSRSSRRDELQTELERTQARVEKLEADKRRLERLLSMTQKVVKPGSVARSRKRRGSGTAGKDASPASRPRKKKASKNSTPTPASGAGS